MTIFNRAVEVWHGFMHRKGWIQSPDRPLFGNAGLFEDYLDFYHNKVRGNMSCWMGKILDKFPMDAWVYQEIVYETKPDVIIEVGNSRGGSTLMLANLLDILGKGRVVGVDTDHSQIDFEHDRIAWVTGDANSPGVVSEVASFLKKKDRCMVIEDSSHTYENTISVLRNYAPFVTAGMYFIVEDGVCRYPFIDGPKPGPYEAVQAFLKENPEFEVDKSREKFVLTYNPSGYLKRIKKGKGLVPVPKPPN